MKKKMAAAQFERWSRYVVELRDAAEHGELPYDEYQKKIRE